MQALSSSRGLVHFAYARMGAASALVRAYSYKGGSMTTYLGVTALIVSDTVRVVFSTDIGRWLYFCFVLVLVCRLFAYAKRGGRKR